MKYKIALLAAICNLASAQNSDIQAQLMNIAAEEAQIANIGANKYMMIYGKDNPIPTINQWNSMEHHPALTVDQITQINKLEAQKQQLLKGVANN